MTSKKYPIPILEEFGSKADTTPVGCPEISKVIWLFVGYQLAGKGVIRLLNKGPFPKEI